MRPNGWSVVIERADAAGVVAALIVIGTVMLSAQDRPVRVIVPEPSPVWLEEGLVFTDTGVVMLFARNQHTAPVLVTTRAWVFGERGELKGTSSYCSGEWLDRGMRRSMISSLEVPGVSTRDTVVVTVAHVASSRARWDLRQSPAEQVQAAWTTANGKGSRLSLAESRADGPPDESGPFACEAIGRACEDVCRDGVKAFTCASHQPPAWSANCACK